MAITMELQSVSQEDDGDYTVTVRAVREDGKILIKGKNFTCSTPSELKALIKPKFELLVYNEKKNNQIRALAQSVIDEILSEVNQ